MYIFLDFKICMISNQSFTYHKLHCQQLCLWLIDYNGIFQIRNSFTIRAASIGQNLSFSIVATAHEKKCIHMCKEHKNYFFIHLFQSCQGLSDLMYCSEIKNKICNLVISIMCILYTGPVLTPGRDGALPHPIFDHQKEQSSLQ